MHKSYITARTAAPPAAAEIRALVAADPGRAYCSIWGEPNRALSTRRELRWGRRGSRCVSLVGDQAGLWFCHETGRGGSFFDAVADAMQERHFPVVLAAAAETLRGSALGRPPKRSATAATAATAADRQGRIERALRIWADAESVHGTPAERYLIERRGLAVPDGADGVALRFHQAAPFERDRAPALVALKRDARTGEPVGVQLVILQSEGAKVARRSHGCAGYVMLPDAEDVTHGLHLCEGLEDAIALHLNGWRPVWAACGAGGIGGFPVLPELTLTIFADDDEAGRKAALQTVNRYREAGEEARALAFVNADPNDALRVRR